jgi:uncharacterized membrane protein YeaQ/YmgE (transglycosylase-associated protein family)
MGILSWILVGAVAGWLADTVVKGKGQGCIFSIVLGIVGALVGGWLAGALFGVADPLTGFNLYTLIVAFIGALIVTFIARALFKGRSPV